MAKRTAKKPKDEATPPHQNDYFTKDAKAAARILADADEYRAAGAFIVPEKSRWSYILQHAQADTIKSILDDVLELLEKTYPDKLRGLLPRIHAHESRVLAALRDALLPQLLSGEIRLHGAERAVDDALRSTGTSTLPDRAARPGAGMIPAGGRARA